MSAPRSPSGGRLRWVVAAVLLVGALALVGRLLEVDGGPGASAGTAPASRTGAPATTLAAGAVQVEGVPLVLTSQAFRASCQRAADRLGFAVPCPELLPVPASGAPPSRLCGEPGACLPAQLFWFSLEGFVVPPGSTGAPGSLGALTILATPNRRAAGGSAFRCPTRRPTAAPTLDERPAELTVCRPGFQGWSTESVLLRWSRRDTFVSFALRGPSDHNQRLLVTLASRLELVPPQRRPASPDPTPAHPSG